MINDPRNDVVFDQLETEVINNGLSTDCETCVGLSTGTLEFKATSRGLIPSPIPTKQVQLPIDAYDACPGKGLHYPELCDDVFKKQPENWLMGTYRRIYVGYSQIPDIRRRGASDGVITGTLIYLLESGLIDGAVVVSQGQPEPWSAESIVAHTADEIIAASQSVYVPIPVNSVLTKIESFEGVLAYVGLPDQVASLRRLQGRGHPAAKKVEYVIGPYVGTSMYFGAIESFLRSNGIRDLNEVTQLHYREGEWPGHLQIETRSGGILKAAKFYYNYLIPFYVTRSTLLSADFTHELTDLSVGDAWHPKYEAQGKGFSVVVVRTEKGEKLLQSMLEQDLIGAEEISLDDALEMHGHMIDFKKRGAFVRMDWQAAFGKPVPDYGYRPKTIPLFRRFVEVVIYLLFQIGSTRLARRLVEWVPISILGPIFNLLRKAWKGVSKPAKRKGLRDLEFITTSD